MEVENAFWRVAPMEPLHLLPVPPLLPASIWVLVLQSSAALSRGWFIITLPDGKSIISLQRSSGRVRVSGGKHVYAVGPKGAKTLDSTLEAALLWLFLS